MANIVVFTFVLLQIALLNVNLSEAQVPGFNFYTTIDTKVAAGHPECVAKMTTSGTACMVELTKEIVSVGTEDQEKLKSVQCCASWAAVGCAKKIADESVCKDVKSKIVEQMAASEKEVREKVCDHCKSGAGDERWSKFGLVSFIFVIAFLFQNY